MSNNDHNKTKLQPMTIGQLARSYGMSIKMFKEILLKLEFTHDCLESHPSALRIVSPRFIKEVAERLGDEELKLDYQRETYTSLAKKLNYSRKKLKKDLDLCDEVQFEIEQFSNFYNFRVLLPGQVKIIKEFFGFPLEEQD